MAKTIGGMLQWFKAAKRKRAKKRLLLQLQTAKGLEAIEAAKLVITEFDSRWLTSEYSRKTGKAIRVSFYSDPIGLLKSVTEFHEALSSGAYLVIPPMQSVATNFEDWYGHHGSSINTEVWLPSLCKEVATLAKVMREADLCAMENYSYYLRKSGNLISDLVMFAIALLALGE